MGGTTTILIFFTAMVALLGLFTSMRPEFTAARGGKIMAFVALCILPVLSVWAGFHEQVERSTSTQFCLSCHVMSSFGKSLTVDDKSFIPAAHFQNNFVPRDHACFTCHTDYTMFGDYKAKWRGVHHVIVQYFGKIPKPEDIKLYTPYNNRECLHCHAGARSYEEASSHHKTPDMLAKAASNQLSCTSSGCHDIVHNVGDLGDATFWTPKADPQ
ncbi:MAG TPA: NapC/NirT family cytochrome c [Candidatus Saccharimonadales bacterium]|nr:NapC/NirT family cytochrome c [Candidatus Saccharimonadales bacterium]